MGRTLAYGFGKCFLNNIEKVCCREEIKYVIDQSAEKWGTYYRDIKCISIEEIDLHADDTVILFLDDPNYIIEATRLFFNRGCSCIHYSKEKKSPSKENDGIKYIPIPKLIYQDKVLKGKRAIIFGGTGGIGLAIAEKFVENGCELVTVGRNRDKLQQIKNQIGCSTAEIDIRDYKHLSAKLKEVIEDQLNGRVDILVNGAGVLKDKSFFEISEDDYDEIMDTNLKSLYFASKIVGEYMMRNEPVDEIRGHILNVSSASAIRPAWTPYQISKWGVRGFTEGLADIMLKYGIIVNAIAPGPVATKMLNKESTQDIYRKNQPSKRYAMASEIADWALCLVSDMGNLVVGDSIYVSGGSAILSKHR